MGALRGESDLAPILPWLRRYSRWLEDRVRLNAGVRAFLWVVKAPGRLRSELVERYRQPPEPGSVVIADEQESWTAVAPNLHANDAANDGRAIRWMIAAGGPGTSLLDLGEGEDSNLATGQVMVEMRRRFLRRRQTYLGWLLADVLCAAWRMAGQTVARRDARPVTVADWTVEMPDISAEDNQKLAAAAAQLAGALTTVAGLVGQGPALQRVALRWFTKFAGEQLSQEEFEAILPRGRRGSTRGAKRGMKKAKKWPGWALRGHTDADGALLWEGEKEGSLTQRARRSCGGRAAREREGWGRLRFLLCDLCAPSAPLR